MIINIAATLFFIALLCFMLSMLFAFVYDVFNELPLFEEVALTFIVIAFTSSMLFFLVGFVAILNKLWYGQYNMNLTLYNDQEKPTIKVEVPTCKEHNIAMMLLLGSGWDCDRFLCPVYRCEQEVELESSSFDFSEV